MKRPTPRTLLGVAVIAWALVVVVAGVSAARGGRPTVREQTTIVEALPTVDRALSSVAAAASGPRAVVAVGGYQRVRTGCRAGSRSGEQYERAVTVFVQPGAEPAVVDRVAAVLPRSPRPVVRHAGSVHGLRADVGFFVQLAGGRSAPGELRFTADTGCRVRGGAVPVAAVRPGVEGAPPVLPPLLDRLAVRAVEARHHELGCPSGGVLRTVEITAGRPAGPLSPALPTGVASLTGQDDVLAYLDGAVGVALRLRADDLLVTASTGCG